MRELRDRGAPGESHVFPGPRHKPISNPQKWMVRLKTASKIDFKFHDLRRTAASHMTGACGISRFVVGQVLNHQERGITRVYDRHSYDREKEAALGKWDQRLAAIVTRTLVGKAGDTASSELVA